MNILKRQCFFRSALLLIALFTGVGTHHSSAQMVALKNNMAYDALLTPNIGFEVALNKKLTLDTQVGMNFFFFERNATSPTYKTKKWAHWLVQPELRYWTCESFYGLFIGVHALGGQANIGGLDIPFVIENKNHVMKNHRYEAWFVGGGVSVGYQWVISNRFLIETSVGAGYVRANYDKFPCVRCGQKIASGGANYFGPTKATISLVFLLK